MLCGLLIDHDSLTSTRLLFLFGSLVRFGLLNCYDSLLLHGLLMCGGLLCATGSLAIFGLLSQPGSLLLHGLLPCLGFASALFLGWFDRLKIVFGFLVSVMTEDRENIWLPDVQTADRSPFYP